MARKQLTALAVLVASGNVVGGVTLTAYTKGKGDIAFTATVVIDDLTNVTPYIVADDAGKVRRFADVDDFLKAAGPLNLISNATDVTLANLEVVAPKEFTGDIIKRNQSIMAAYEKRVLACAGRVTGLTSQITLAESTPGVSAALVAELQEQLATVNGLVTVLNAEITRIDAIINPAP